MIVVKAFVLGILRTNTYVVYDDLSKDAFIVDPGEKSFDVLNFVVGRGLRVRAVVATHGHFDHVLGVDFLRNSLGAEFYMHSDDVDVAYWSGELARRWGIEVGSIPKPDKTLCDGDVLELGSIKIGVVHTPGHSPGSTSLYVESIKTLFTGDTLFREAVGRTDLLGGSEEMLKQSIRRIFRVFPLETVVYPGHGPFTTLGHEYERNMFVRMFLGLQT